MHQSRWVVWVMLCAVLVLLVSDPFSSASGQIAPVKRPLTVKPIVNQPRETAPTAVTSGVSSPIVKPPAGVTMPVLSIFCPALQLVCPTVLPPATVNADYLYPFKAAGGFAPLSYVLENEKFAPEGLRLNPDGTLQGRPSKAGEYLLLVLVRDKCPKGVQQLKKTFSLTIKPTKALMNQPVLKTEITITGKNPAVPLAASAPQPDLNKPSLNLPRTVMDSKPDLKKMDPGLLKPGSGLKRPSGVTLLKRALSPAEEEQEQDQAPHIEKQIVITLQMEKGAALIKQLQQKYQLKLIESFTIKALKQIAATFMTDQELPILIRKIRAEPGIILVQSNRAYGTFGEPKSDLQNVCQVLNFAGLHKYRRGKGVLVALIDTGVDLDHRDLQKRIIFHRNYVPNSTYRAEIHGTAVAGIIAAGINKYGMEGIAPEVNLLALRACEQVSEQDPMGRGSTISILKALDTAIEKRAKIVNMSFGSPSPDPLIARILEEGAQLGILFTAPVGNRAGQSFPTFPASSPVVIAVAGSDQNGRPYPDETLAAFAQVLAPSENILATVPGNKHNFMTGTSFSSAIVAGILALAVERNRALNQESLPVFQDELCAWTEQLLNMKSVCLR